MNPRISAFNSGVRSLLPVQLGVLPFGLIAGAIAVDIGMPPIQALLTSIIVYAGAAQLVVYQLLDSDAPLLVILASAVIVNLRYVMYSAGIAPHFRSVSIPFRAFLTYILSDQAYAVFVLRYEDGATDENRHWFYFGGAFSMWLGFVASTAVGAFLGAQIPASWSLDFAVPLTFMAITIPSIKSRATVAAALVGGTVAVLADSMPLELGLITAACAGIAAGIALESRAA